jgi:hypothetical protein
MHREDPLRQRYLHRFRIGLVLLVLLAIPAVVHSNAAIDSLFNRPADWVPDSIPEKAEFNSFMKYFSVSELIMVAWEGSVLDSPTLEQAAAVLHPLCESRYDAASDASVLAELPPATAARILEIRRKCSSATPLQWVRTGTETLERLTSPPASLSLRAATERLQGSLIGADGKQTCLLISFGHAGLTQRRMLIPEIRDLISGIAECEPDQIAVVGGPFDGATVDDESIRSIRLYTPPSALIAAVLCLLCLRSIPLTGTTLAVAVIGEGLVLAAVYYTGVPMNAVLIVLPPLVFVLTVSAGIHLSNYYIDVASEFPQLSRAEAAARAMRAGLIPCCVATGTTVVGFCSLLLVRLEPVRIFGGIASLGVILTLLLLFLLLPGAMVLTAPRQRAARGVEQRASGWQAWSWDWTRRRLARPWPLMIGFLLAAGGFSVGLTRLESSVNVPRMFRPDSDIRRQYAWFEQHVGPTVTGELLLTFPALREDDDPLPRLRTVAQAHTAAIKLPIVGGAISAVTFVPTIPPAKEPRRSLAATAQRSVVRKLIRDPDSSLGRLGFIARDADREIWRINVLMPQHERADFGDDIDAILTAVRQRLADSEVPVQISLTGSVVIVQKAQEILLSDLFRSFVSAFGLIALVMILTLRSFIGGLLAMAPNLFPTVALFGMMGLARIPLDIGSVMSASVALGIAVDNTAHLLGRFGSRRAHGIGQIRAAHGALAQCGWAMFETTLVCAVSLMVYYFSDFVPTSQFSLFMFAMLTIALIGVIFLLPALMASPLGRFLAHTVGADPSATIFADEPGEGTPPDVRRLPTHWQMQLPLASQASVEPPQRDPKLR